MLNGVVDLIKHTFTYICRVFVICRVYILHTHTRVHKMVHCTSIPKISLKFFLDISLKTNTFSIRD